MNFAFFDLETTGISPAFDQPLQFAAILTDSDFKEIERVDMRCRLAPHIIPSPHALAVTGLRPDQLIDPALPGLFEFTQSLTELVSRWSPAIWTGFNSIRFDEEMLRQAFYQNLQAEVFATQFNGNTRFDIMTAVFGVWHRHRDLLDWPVDETGKVRFNLDRLAPLNGFVDHNAHDALGDVEATIHLAKLIARRDPRLWTELLASRDKGYVKARLERFSLLELVGRFGGAPPKAITGCLCGYSTKNANQAFFFDLDAADPVDLMNASDETFAAALEAMPWAIRSLTINKAPVLLEPAETTDEHERRAHLIAEAPQFRERVVQMMAARYPTKPDAQPLAVEKQIFNGFYSWADKERLKVFQRSDWLQRQEIVATFDDSRLRQLGRRLIAFYAHDLLSEEEQRQYDEWLHGRWQAASQLATEWMTIEKARQAVAEMRASSNYDSSMLDEIEAFLGCFDDTDGIDNRA